MKVTGKLHPTSVLSPEYPIRWIRTQGPFGRGGEKKILCPRLETNYGRLSYRPTLTGLVRSVMDQHISYLYILRQEIKSAVFS